MQERAEQKWKFIRNPDNFPVIRITPIQKTCYQPFKPCCQPFNSDPITLPVEPSPRQAYAYQTNDRRDAMSKETLDQFIQQISDSEELQARIGEEIDGDTLIALGAEHGCEFSAEDLVENAELSDEELDGVAGGMARSQVLFKTPRGVQSANGDFRIVLGLNSSADDAAGRKLVCDGSST
ncbi:MAG TPA: Nif11-like leader peptide family natural product precursor [Gammaproteobacteria bacterium]|nr:Nif11-like leader peptide family natural product precursor [Gammaproteobacteria bacterium]